MSASFEARSMASEESSGSGSTSASNSEPSFKHYRKSSHIHEGPPNEASSSSTSSSTDLSDSMSDEDSKDAKSGNAASSGRNNELYHAGCLIRRKRPRESKHTTISSKALRNRLSTKQKKAKRKLKKSYLEELIYTSESMVFKLRDELSQVSGAINLPLL